MNSCNFVGNITRDLEIKFANNEKGTPIMKFSIAVYRDKENTDFINCIAFNKTAELIANFFVKGSTIGVSGKLQTGSYTNKNDIKVYTTDLVVNNVTFIDKKKKTKETDYTNSMTEKELEDVTQLDDGETPF